MSPTQHRGRQSPGYVRHPGTTWIEANWSALPNDVWVAADGNGTVASAESMDALRSRLQAAGRNEDEVAVVFVSRDAL